MKETNPNFCTGVQILISRMKSNPEEFTSGDKWTWLMNKVVDTKLNPSHHSANLAALNQEEIDALFEVYQPFLRKGFNDSVLREVLSSEEKELSYSMTSAPNVVLGTPTTATGIYAFHQPTTMERSLSIGNVKITEVELETIKRRVL
jgi:hypothetical protein